MKKWKKITLMLSVLICLLIITLPLVVSCATNIDGVNASTIVNLIFPNIWVFVATILAVIILFSVAIWFVWKPFNKKMKERKDYIMKELQDVQKAKEDALCEKQKATEDYLKSQIEIQKLVSNAREKGNQIYNELEKEGYKKSHLLIKNAKQEIELEKQILQDEMNAEIIDVAFAAVTEISKQRISKEENDKLVQEFIKDLEKGKINE